MLDYILSIMLYDIMLHCRYIMLHSLVSDDCHLPVPVRPSSSGNGKPICIWQVLCQENIGPVDGPQKPWAKLQQHGGGLFQAAILVS